ncbi:MAG: hypothetical protein NT045_06960 [Candidatus Aureabacteria bacterium]|nr:hypothetical protein [Candidatus Auribacterota bacterium]
MNIITLTRTSGTFAGILVLCALTLATSGCERRIVRKGERPFMNYAEKNWRGLTPRQKADYYEMIEKQKDRARKETGAEQKGASW